MSAEGGPAGNVAGLCNGYVTKCVTIWLPIQSFRIGVPLKRRMVNILRVAIIFFFLTGYLTQDLAPNTPEFTREEARLLVISALKASTHFTKAPGFGLDAYDDPYFPNFYAFEALWDNPTPSGSIHLGFYMVNRKTASVWDVGDVDNCDRLTTPSIEDFHKKLQKRSGLTQEQFRRLDQEAPCHPRESWLLNSVH